MKRQMFAAVAAASLCAAAAEEVELEKEDSPVTVWGFGNYGMYSGYQLYGSLLNSEPTLQGYAELNFQFSVDELDLGYLGAGVWSNTDLTDKRHESYGQAFNEWDPNVHYGRTFWFDDEQTWGIDYRTVFVWYIYPQYVHNSRRSDTPTTMDWNHSFALKNPFVVPFFTWVHEYHETDANLLEFGLRRDFEVAEGFSLTPSATFVARDHRYNWCFPTAGFTEFHNGGMATATIGLDATYQISKNFGVFAKVAFCTTMDKDLRDASDNSHGADYGKYKDFAWGGFGVTFNF